MMKISRIVALVFGCLCFLVWTRSAFCLPPIERTVLDNGVVLLVSEEHSLPFVSILLLVKAGSKDDPSGQEGIADLTASSLLLGAAGRSLERISEDLDYMGASIDANANKDFTTVGLLVLRKDLRRAFPIFMDVLTKPTFPAKELQKRTSRVLGAIRSEEDEPGVVAEKAFIKALYMDGPYGHPAQGTLASVGRMSRPKAAKFHETYYRPNNSIMVVVGDIDKGTVRDFLIPSLQEWRKKDVPQERVQNRFPSEKQTVRIDRPVSQSNILIGNGAMSRENADYYAASVLNHVLGGGGLGSRLMEDIRVKRGLAYSVESYFDAGKLPGSFQISLQTKTASTGEAVRAILDNVNQVRTNLVTEEELADAKSYLVGSFPQKLGSQSRIASFFAQVEYYGLGLQYPDRYPGLINSVTREDVLRVARTYLLPDRFVTVLVGDLKAIDAGQKSPSK
jgi:zinc protease